MITTRDQIKGTMLIAMSEYHSGNSDEALRIVEAQLSAIEAAGVRLVPVNMTDEQMIAAERAVQASMDRGESAPIRFAALSVSAMLAASPYAQKDETND